VTEQIVVDPSILVGKPVVRGTRLGVAFLLGLMADGWPEAEILRNYPGLTRDDLLACLAYAQERVNEERVYPLPGAA
jgi:uncharacterized protein (DUF433 family)